MKHAFEIRNLSVEFNKRPVIEIETFDFAAGKIHALIGPSGAGKSTLLRTLNLLQKPSKGQITYFGQSLQYYGSSKLVAQRSMSMVFQKPSMFSGSVYYNVSLGLRLRRYKSSEVKTRVSRALEMVGLSDFSNRSASTLSGGEAQRAALARALVTQPKILLLDEPTANLDPANVSMIENIIKKIHSETKLTIIIVTHNLYQAQRLSNQTVFLDRGKVIESNSTDDIFNHPNTKETKLFISGEMIY